MKSSKNFLRRTCKKYPEWVDLWEHGERPVQGVTHFPLMIKTVDGEVEMGVELKDPLALLLLDEYAADLNKQGKGKRKLQLENIKEELRFPWLDLRPSIQRISDSEMFTAATGEK